MILSKDFYNQIKGVAIINTREYIEAINNATQLFTYPNNKFCLNKDFYKSCKKEDINILINVNNINLFDVLVGAQHCRVNVAVLHENDLLSNDVLLTDAAYIEDGQLCVKESPINQYLLLRYKEEDNNENN